MARVPLATGVVLLPPCDETSPTPRRQGRIAAFPRRSGFCSGSLPWPLVTVALLRVVAWDAVAPLAILNSVTIAVYLPAWPIVFVATLFRQWLLAIVALLVIVAQIMFLAPEFNATQPLPAWTRISPTFELLDGNVYNENPSMSGYAAQIRELHPQVVSFEEATTSDVAQLRESGALAPLPYQFEVRGYSPFAFLIASHYPLRNTNVIWMYGNLAGSPNDPRPPSWTPGPVGPAHDRAAPRFVP